MVKRIGGALLLSLVIDRNGPETISNQLYTALRDFIHIGGLHLGERLPASRTLARDLQISRTTVINVFDRLYSEGLIESRTGAGTFVSDMWMSSRPDTGSQAASLPVRKPRLSNIFTHASEVFVDRLPHQAKAFTTALPAFDAFPRAIWAQLETRHWRAQAETTMGYTEPGGYPPLRQAIASHLLSNRGIQCEASQIFIVSGAQHGFLDIVPTNTGLHTIGRFSHDYSETAVAEAALKKGLVVTPIERFCINPSDVRGLVLGFSCIQPREIVAGVKTLAEVFKGLYR